MSSNMEDPHFLSITYQIRCELRGTVTKHAQSMAYRVMIKFGFFLRVTSIKTVEGGSLLRTKQSQFDPFPKLCR